LASPVPEPDVAIAHDVTVVDNTWSLSGQTLIEEIWFREKAPPWAWVQDGEQ
jgi:hypothetical protein